MLTLTNFERHPSNLRLVNAATIQYFADMHTKKQSDLLDQLFRSLVQRWPTIRSEFIAASEHHRFDDLADGLHKLKGHVGMLGLDALYRVCHVLEDACRNFLAGTKETQSAESLELLAVNTVTELEACFWESLHTVAQMIPNSSSCLDNLPELASHRGRRVLKKN